MFDLSLHNILHSNVFNFVLLIIILYVLAAPILKKSISETNKKVTDIVQDSINNKEKALQNLENAKADYANTPKETAEIEEIAKNTVESIKQKSKEDTEKIKKTISDNAVKAIDNETTKITSQLSQDTAEQSVQTALEKIKAKLSQDENLHDSLIEKAIEELENI